MTHAEAELERAAAAWDEACREAAVAATMLGAGVSSHAAARTYSAARMVATDLGEWLDSAIAAWEAAR